MRNYTPIAWLRYGFNPYVLIVVGLLFVWSTPFQIYHQISARQETQRLEAIPSWSPDAIEQEISAIEHRTSIFEFLIAYTWFVLYLKK
jgi:hypothetical protein